MRAGLHVVHEDVPQIVNVQLQPLQMRAVELKPDDVCAQAFGHDRHDVPLRLNQKSVCFVLVTAHVHVRLEHQIGRQQNVFQRGKHHALRDRTHELAAELRKLAQEVHARQGRFDVSSGVNQLFQARNAQRHVLARHASHVERAQSQLRSRLAYAARRQHPDHLASLDARFGAHALNLREDPLEMLPRQFNAAQVPS